MLFEPFGLDAHPDGDVDFSVAVFLALGQFDEGFDVHQDDFDADLVAGAFCCVVEGGELGGKERLLAAGGNGGRVGKVLAVSFTGL